MGRYRDRQEVLTRGLDRNQNGKKNGDEEQDDRITSNTCKNTFDHAIYLQSCEGSEGRKNKRKKDEQRLGKQKGKARKIPPAGRPAGNLCHPGAVG